MLSPPNLGTVTGIIGAITGCAGCITGWISLRRSQQIKALDLRLELRRQVSDVRAEVEALPALLERARASRRVVRAAMGRGPQSGYNVIWMGNLENDLKIAQALAPELPDAKETYRRSKPHELENKLVEVHALARKAQQLRDKYEAEWAADNKDRDYIRDNAPTGFK